MIQIDMPMPDNCGECRFNVSEFGYCNAMPVNFCGQVNDFEEDGRPEWCPLKEQKPRVMTLEEYKASAEKPKEERDPVWEEWPGLKCTWEMPNQAYGGYGTSWRAWTSRPTDEVRSATPWE